MSGLTTLMVILTSIRANPRCCGGIKNSSAQTTKLSMLFGSFTCECHRFDFLKSTPPLNYRFTMPITPSERTFRFPIARAIGSTKISDCFSCTTIALLFVAIFLHSCNEDIADLSTCSFNIQHGMADLTGSSDVWQYGNNISISGDGNSVAIFGGGGNSGVAPFVDVLRTKNGAWVKVGQPLTAAVYKPTIALDFDGQTLAMSKPGEIEIYKISGDKWVKQSAIGLSFMSNASLEFKMNRDATVILVNDNSWNNNVGRIRVFEAQGAGWVQKGADITDSNGSEMGTFSFLSADGLGIITNVSGGSNLADPIISRAYRFENGSWLPKGNDFSSPYSYSYSSNSNLTKVAITRGDVGNEKTEIYNFINNGWVLEASISNTSVTGSNFIARISDEGSILVVLSYSAQADKDQVRVYKNCNNTWVEATNRADFPLGNTLGLFFGALVDNHTIHVDAKGQKILSAAPASNQNTGLVRLYELK